MCDWLESIETESPKSATLATKPRLFLLVAACHKERRFSPLARRCLLLVSWDKHPRQSGAHFLANVLMCFVRTWEVIITLLLFRSMCSTLPRCK